MPYLTTGNKAVDDQTALILRLVEAEEENRRVGKALFDAKMAARDALSAICFKEGVEYPWITDTDAEDDIQEAGHAPSRD